jgi:hypothetical protein
LSVTSSVLALASILKRLTVVAEATEEKEN